MRDDELCALRVSRKNDALLLAELRQQPPQLINTYALHRYIYIYIKNKHIYIYVSKGIYIYT